MGEITLGAIPSVREYITVKAGSTLRRRFQVTRDGVAFSLAGCTPVYELKSELADADAAAKLKFTKTLTDGMQLVVDDEEPSFFELRATAAKMRLTAGKYFGALQFVVDATGELVEVPSDLEADRWLVNPDVILATS